jgi:hypothetical protein
VPHKTRARQPGLYIIGYFTISEILDFTKLSDFEDRTYRRRLMNNAHLKRDDDCPIIAVGDPDRSELLRKAILISRPGLDSIGRPIHLASTRVEQQLGIHGSLTRAVPHHVNEQHIENLISMLSQENAE